MLQGLRPRNLIPGWGTKILPAMWHGQKKIEDINKFKKLAEDFPGGPGVEKILHAEMRLSPCATTIETALESVFCNERIYCSEKPAHSNEDPVQP